MIDARSVIVVGAGPAGVSVALGLVRSGVPVVLVTGGGRREDDDARDRLRGAEARGVWSHEDLSLNRRAMVGGTSTAWGGRCVQLDAIDFARRAWIPHSGWPITHAEYLRWIPAASALLEIPHSAFHRSVGDDLLAGGRTGAGRTSGITSDDVEVWSRPTDFSVYVRSELEASTLCTVLHDAHAVGLLIEGDTVDGVVVQGVGGRREVRAGRVVLAAGTLESTRLLLESSWAVNLPALGRYYQSHTFATLMRFTGGALSESSSFFKVEGAYARNRWRLADDVQAEDAVANAIGFVARPPADANSIHVDALTAAIVLAKTGLRAARAPHRAATVLRTERNALRGATRVLMRADARTWWRLLRQGAARAGGRRLPIVLPPLDAPFHSVTFQGEHLPNPHSAVRLGDGLDADGRRRLEVDIDFGRKDFETVASFHEHMAELLRSRGYTVLDEPGGVAARLAAQMSGAFNSNAHSIGTTRMSVDRETGVVDPDLLVHGTRNAYVISAGVFPTSGHANPTLSVVALACRLAEHLAGRSG